MKARLICLLRRHQWHNGWDEEEHRTVWTCKRFGTTKCSDYSGDPLFLAPGGDGGGMGGGVVGGGECAAVLGRASLLTGAPVTRHRVG